MFSSTAIIETSALISMLFSYVKPGDRVLPDRVDEIETWNRLFHSMISQLGQPMFLRSILFMWTVSSSCLSRLEAEVFPEQVIFTGSTLPNKVIPRDMGHLCREEWQPNRALLKPSHEALMKFSNFIHNKCDENQHQELFAAVADSMLLIETAAALCNITIQDVDESAFLPASVGAIS